MRSKAILLLSFLLTSIFLTAPHVAKAASYEKPPFNLMFQFGDSISDTGNLVIEDPVGAYAFANFPYGQTMGHPTGRCSDGFLMVDYFAESFNMPLLNPYLNKEANFSNGVNFAVAGSTALDTPTLLGMNVVSPVTRSSLSVQLDWFKSHLQETCGGSSECHDRVADSLVLIETGGNDYNYALLQGKSLEDVQAMVPKVVDAITEATRELVSLGAKRVFIPGNFPIGCLPIYLANFQSQNLDNYNNLNCLRDLNSFARFHNERLQAAIQELSQEYPDVTIVYGDYYSALTWLLENAEDLEFDKGGVQKACCGSGKNYYNFDLTKVCGTKEATVCDTPSRRVSWDGIHMTQRAYLHLAQWLLHKSFKGLLN